LPLLLLLGDNASWSGVLVLSALLVVRGEGGRMTKALDVVAWGGREEEAV
jgi:hypothetical protein